MPPYAMISPSTLFRFGLLCALVFSLGCSSHPPKRVLQYLNQSGFGNRYRGNAEEEAYVTIGDTVAVTDAFWKEDLTVSAKVAIDGTILLPELGAIHVAGKTRTQIQALLTERYSLYYEDLDLAVQIYPKGKVYFILGEILQEGEAEFEGDLTVFQAVLRAQPDRTSANLGRVMLIRSDPTNPLVMPFNFSHHARVGDSTFNYGVQEYDIIWVPPTFLAQVGYFLDALLFPVRQVLTGLAGALFSLQGRSGGRGGGGGAFNFF